MSRHRVLTTATVLLLAFVGSVVPFVKPAAATGPTISVFRVDYCQTVPLPTACTTTAGGPGASYNIVLTWSTNGNDGYIPAYIYDAVDSGSIGFVAASGHKTVAVSSGGRYSYTLQVNYQSAPGQPITNAFATASVDVPALAPPSVAAYSDGTSGNMMYVDQFPVNNVYNDIKTGQQPVITWSAGGAPYTAIEVNPNIFTQWPAATSATSHSVTASDLSKITNTFELRSCVDTSTSPAFCSAAVTVTATKVGTQIQGPYRQFVPVGGSATVTLSVPPHSPGNFFFVQASTLSGGGSWTTGSSTNPPTVQVPTPSAAVIPVHVLSCIYGQPNCGPTTNITVPTNTWPSPLKLTTTLMPTSGWVNSDQPVAVVTDNAGGQHNITAGTSGFIGQPSQPIAQNATVTAGEIIGNVVYGDSIELVVGNGGGNSLAANFTSKAWTSDFSQTNSQVYPYDAAPGLGVPTKSAIDANGHIYAISEFSSALGEIDPTVSSPTAAVNSHEIPIAFSTTLQGTVYPQTTPFTSPGTSSALGEGAIYADGRVWAIQGGGFEPGPGKSNHSRIISFNPTAPAGDPSLNNTEYDNRFCVYSVPGNDNEIYDLTWDGTRIWFSELNGGIDWFDPTQLSCDSMLDYSKLDASNNVIGAHSYCPTNGPNCVHTIPPCSSTVTTGCAPPESNFIKLIADPDPNPGGNNNHLWYTGINGALGELTYDAQGNMTSVQQWCNSYPSAPFVNTCPGTTPAFPSGTFDAASPFTWNAVVYNNNVYMVDSNEMRLVKFDETHQTFSEIPLPVTSHDASTHYLLSLGVFNNELYFVTQDGWNNAVLGNIDIASWNNGAPTGTIYTGLTSFNAPGHDQFNRAAYDGLSFNPTDGSIVFTDFWRKQIYLLRH